MSIRPLALKWFSEKYGPTEDPIYTSKFYAPEESWTKREAWAIQVRKRRLEAGQAKDIHIILQKNKGSHDFHYLKVPTRFFLENQEGLFLRENVGTFIIFLSAENANQFQDQRGKGKLNFSDFLVE